MDEPSLPINLMVWAALLLGAAGLVTALAVLVRALLGSAKDRTRDLEQRRLTAFALTVSAEAAIQAGLRQFRLVRRDAAGAGLQHVLALLDPLIERQDALIGQLQTVLTELSKRLPDDRRSRRDFAQTLDGYIADAQAWANDALRQQRSGALLDEIRESIRLRSASAARPGTRPKGR